MKPARLLFFFLAIASLSPLYAGDGFDNNYLGSGSNRIGVIINGEGFTINFGPSAATWGIPIPNGTTYTHPGSITSLNINSATAIIRSAYYDRVLSTTLFWRIYPENNPPSGMEAEPGNFPNFFNLSAVTKLDEDSCFTSTQGEQWQANVNVNVLSGLTQGQTYILEFFIIHDLYDVGDESELLASNCTQGGYNVTLCQNVNQLERYLKSTYNTTDPTTCNYDNVVANQSHATRFRFGYGVAAPLSWTAFSAKRLNADVELQWKTELEYNLDRFVVERHLDVGSWQPVGAVTAYNSATPSTYTYTDAGAPQDNLYYRLRAEDFDGTYEYSNVVALAAVKGTHLRILPNPAGSFADLLLEEGAHVQIFDAYGHTLYNNPEADGNVRIETFDWPSGMYSVWVLGASGAVLERAALLVEH